MQPTNPNVSQEGLARSAAYWGARLPTSDERAAAIAQTRQVLYQESLVYEGLQSYASRPVKSKWMQSETTPNESDAAYVARLRPFLKHLADEAGNLARPFCVIEDP